MHTCKMLIHIKMQIKVLQKYLPKNWQTVPFQNMPSGNSLIGQQEARRVSGTPKRHVLWKEVFVAKELKEHIVHDMLQSIS